jgi:hypothetical protein
VRWFLENPEEALEDARRQLLAADEDGELEGRLASLKKRLATKQAEKGRYIKLYAQGHLDDEELDAHLLDLRNQIENLNLLIASVESDLATQEQNRLAAQDAAAWLLTLRERVAELEAHTEEAHRKRRELVRLLVKQITIDTNEDGATEVRTTYRFGPPTAQQVDGFSHGVALSRGYGNIKSVASAARPARRRKRTRYRRRRTTTSF